MLTPGKNRFGGTMRFFYGPNHVHRQLVSTASPFLSSAFGGAPPNLTTYDASQVGQFVDAGHSTRNRLTFPYDNAKLIYGYTTPSFARCAPGSGTVRPPTNPGCDYYVRKVQSISTIAPFTTGMVTAWAPVGFTTTLITLTGYDNRTSAGLNGVISLVRPRLVHSYLRPDEYFPAPIYLHRTWQTVARFSFDFVPEPGLLLQCVSGLLGLAILDRRRRNASR